MPSVADWEPAYSRHAARRSQSRSIPPRLFALVLAHADIDCYVWGGLKAAMVTRRKLARMKREMTLPDREALDSLIVVYDPADGYVVTAFHDLGGHRGKAYRRR